jgi:hypothetical protein
MPSEIEIGQAIATIREMKENFSGRLDRLDAHAERQDVFNKEITERVVEIEKADITINGKLDTVIKNQDQEREDRRRERESIWTRLGILTPWLFLLGVLAYFYIQNKGPMGG